MPDSPARKPMRFLAAMQDFFGRKPNQTLQDFAAECNQLTDEDKSEFRSLLTGAGYDITN